MQTITGEIEEIYVKDGGGFNLTINGIRISVAKNLTDVILLKERNQIYEGATVMCTYKEDSFEVDGETKEFNRCMNVVVDEAGETLFNEPKSDKSGSESLKTPKKGYSEVGQGLGMLVKEAIGLYGKDFFENTSIRSSVLHNISETFDDIRLLQEEKEKK